MKFTFLVQGSVSLFFFSLGFPGGSESKESACNEDLGSIPGSERSAGEGNGSLRAFLEALS